MYTVCVRVARVETVTSRDGYINANEFDFTPNPLNVTLYSVFLFEFCGFFLLDFVCLCAWFLCTHYCFHSAIIYYVESDDFSIEHSYTNYFTLSLNDLM